MHHLDRTNAAEISDQYVRDALSYAESVRDWADYMVKELGKHKSGGAVSAVLVSALEERVTRLTYTIAQANGACLVQGLPCEKCQED